MNPLENYFLETPEPMQSILLYVRQVIKETLPEVEEKYKYKIPFYYFYGKPLCYLNILKGTNYVDVGFWNGFKLSNKHSILKAGRGGIMVKSIQYKTLESIDADLFVEVLLEASLI